MQINKQASLQSYNTFGVIAHAQTLLEFETLDDLNQIINDDLLQDQKVFILGGGSNVLFTQNYDGVILHSKISDLEVICENDQSVEIRCGSGINWDWFVAYCVDKGWYGIENLSDIPGNIGAAPVQNIGAYGVEAKDTIVKVEGVDIKTGAPFCYSNSECKFDYRNSIFKTMPDLLVTHVTFSLLKNAQLITHYGNLKEELERSKNKDLVTLREIIIKTRQSKLPSTDELGSGGSFFKNPVVENQKAEELSKKYDSMPSYPYSDIAKKLSAAWLIDQSGLKGIRTGDVGTYPKQPLVIVNYGKARGEEIRNFSMHIQKKVKEKFDITLQPEVIIL